MLHSSISESIAKRKEWGPSFQQDDDRLTQVLSDRWHRYSQTDGTGILSNRLGALKDIWGRLPLAPPPPLPSLPKNSLPPFPESLQHQREVTLPFAGISPLPPVARGQWCCSVGDKRYHLCCVYLTAFTTPAQLVRMYRSPWRALD